MIDKQQIFLIVRKNLMKKVFHFILIFLVPTSLQAQFKLLLSIGMKIINPQVKFLRYTDYPLELRRINAKEIFIINNTITAKEINMNISKNTLLTNYQYGKLQIMYLVVFLLTNVTEATFAIKSTSWFVFVLISLSYPQNNKRQIQQIHLLIQYIAGIILCST